MVDFAYSLISDTPDLNLGGCGIAAYAVYQFLKDVEYYPVEIAYFYRTEDIATAISNNIPSSTNHVMIKFGDHFYDSTGIYTLEQRQNKSYCIVTPEYLYESILKATDWNKQFNRKYITHIEYQLNVDLKLSTPKFSRFAYKLKRIFLKDTNATSKFWTWQ